MSFNPHGRWSRLLAFLLTAFALTAAHGQNAKPEDEYKKLIKVNEEIQPLGEHPFGEKISLYDGSLSFEQVDVSAGGTGPLLQLMRRFNIEGPDAVFERRDYAFGDWDLNLPRIETLTAHGWYYNAITGRNHEVNGWEVDVGADDPNARCSHFSRPPTMTMYMGDPALTPWEPAVWWHGYHLIIPGQGDQNLLSNNDSASKATYPIVTKEHWRISCVATTHNGMPGEGFLAQAPDGTTYRFDELVYRDSRDMDVPLYDGDVQVAPADEWSRYFASGDVMGDVIALLTGSTNAHAAPTVNVIARQRAMMLVTQIKDRFGNTVDFAYDSAGHLTSITASDGRALTIQYVSGSPLIQSVTLQPSSGAPRTWIYSYRTIGTSLTTLTGVTLPDGSHWSFQLDAFDGASLATSGGSCLNIAAPNPAAVTGSITHPSGLNGSFTVAPVKRGRSFVPRGCKAMQYGNPDSAGSYAEIPNAWYTFALTSETLSGAGMPSRSWNYAYSPANDSWSDCTGTCPTTVYTDVTNPENGGSVRHTFSNEYDYTESQLLRTDYYTGAAGASTLLRSETNTYANPATAPLPTRAGGDPQTNTNYDQTTKYSPLSRRVIAQDGDTYTWEAEAFNSFVQVTKVKRCNSFERLCDFTNLDLPPVQEQTDYLNDTTRWVLGLPTKVTNLTTGEVVDQNVYDTTNDTLSERWHFGQKLMSYSFNAQGQLASFTDGNLHTTTLSSYKRGIPQAIGYPDGRSQSLVVDDFGQIQSITDQAGATTAYDYDAVGRLIRIDYPTGDEQAWYPKTFNYDFVAGAERGVGANHWRRTVAKGSQRQVTYFNAMLQPVLTDTYINGNAGSHSNVRNDYDFRGLTTFSSYPLDGTPDLSAITTGTTSAYDALGRLKTTQQASELGPLTTSTAYLSNARKQVTDPKGYVTTTRYQVFDSPSYDAVTEVQAPAGLTQTIARDLYGNPLSITQGGTYGTGTVSVQKTLVYDGYHRLCRTAEPESGSEVLDYDDANNVLWSAAGVAISGTGCGRDQVPPEAKTARHYDAMNRLDSIDYPDSTADTVYTFTATGAVKTAASGIATWTYTYNALGQLTSESLDIEGYHWPIVHRHDRYGSEATTFYPDGKEINYGPDALGRPTKVGTYAADIAYFPNGSVQYYRLGDGTEYMAEQTLRQTLGSLNYFHEGTTPVVAQQYTYDPNGNLTVVDDQVDDRRDKTFGYDALNRLTSAQASNLWGTETYAYDPLNNLRELDSDGLTRTYVYNAINQLAAITNGAGGASLHSYAYDPQGNVIQKDGTSLAFDKANRLNQVVGGSRYDYDASGRRVKKTDTAGNATYYAYTGDGRLLYQFDAATHLVTDYVYMGRQLTAEVHRTEGDLVLNPPSAIAFNANPNDGNYTVSWNSAGTASYELQESIDGGANWVGAYTGSANSASFSGKSAGTHYYRVRACQDECTDWRESAALGVWPALAAVSVPSGLQGGSFTVSWTRPATATRFDVDEQKDGGTWVRIATDTGATSLARSNPAVGSYIYRVSAKNDYGSRGWATSASVTVLYPPASAPTLSAPSVSSTSSYTVSWGAVSSADHYQLQEQINGGAWATKYDGANRSLAISGVTNGADYGYQVRACNAIGCGPYSALATVHIAIPPPPPTGVYTNDLWVNSKLETVTVVWQAVSGASSYKIKDLDTNYITGTTSTSYDAASAYDQPPIDVHSYAVSSCNPYACSGWVNAQYRQVYNPPSTAPTLSAPSGSSSGSYTVSWGTVSMATGYALEQSVNGGAWAAVYTGSGTSKAFSGKPNGSYGYRVRASNSGGNGPWSATKTVQVALPPAVPANLSVSVSGPSYKPVVAVSWSAVSGTTNYQLEETHPQDGVSVYSMGTSTSTSSLIYADGELKYRVRACNAVGCSAWSGYKSVWISSL